MPEVPAGEQLKVHGLDTSHADPGAGWLYLRGQQVVRIVPAPKMESTADPSDRHHGLGSQPTRDPYFL